MNSYAATYDQWNNQNSPFLSEERISLFFTAVWLLYILLSPVYIFSKGLPQPADYLLFFCGFPALFVTMIRHRGSLSKVFLFGLLFAVLTMAINMVHFTFLFNDRLLKHSVYYIFNFSAFYYTLVMFRQSPETMNKLTYIAVATAVVFQFIYAPLFGGIEIFRNTGSFNNPNQLAYWCILSASIIIILKRDQQFSFFDLVLFAMLFYLQSLSLSKAGIIVSALLLPIIVFVPNMPNYGRILVFIGVLGFIITQALEPESLQRRLVQIEQISAVTDRINNIGTESDDSASGRGYDRIIKYPHYILYGAGEGAFSRFGVGAQELHSGLGTILFSYGITGFVFFMMFIYAVFYRLPKQYYLLLGLIFLFGIPHQNIRFTYFWIFLGIAHTHHLYFNSRARHLEQWRKSQE
ncbi:MAG: hypothetical protein HRT94_08610 [Alphaproteobacteria bacterium]|nr:hypothetical protein [Alphaproteobacteria bacterium]